MVTNGITQEGGQKILLMGLDNSGKSSILLSLKGDRNLMSYYSLKPTQAVAYNEVFDPGGHYFIWDMGGQSQYRTRHLEYLEHYLEGVSKIIYVIDVQDKGRYEESLQYLQEILIKLQERRNKIQLVFYLHKFDPQIETDLNNSLHPAIDELVRKIRQITNDPSVVIFKTSIYTIFRKIAV